MSPRIEYEPPSKYSSKVLIGPWVNDRFNSTQYPEQVYRHSSTYRTDYTPKPDSRNDESAVWNQKLKSEESNCFTSQLGRQEYPNYFDNFATSYDLSYNHFPKCCKGHIPRVWRMIKGVHEPLDVYIPSFGNITNYGLLDEKRDWWKYQTSDPRAPDTSSYHCEFQAPSRDYYNFKRYSVPQYYKKNYNIFTDEDVERFCAKPVHEVIESTLITARKEKYCNPITWECTPDM